MQRFSKLSAYIHKRLSLAVLFNITNCFSQAVYDANGQYKGYSQTSPSGVTTIYTPQGQSLGSSQVDNGQTSYYSATGTYIGANTAVPTPNKPNTTINIPRNTPQTPEMKGW